MSTQELNLRFGAAALERGFIDAGQFAAACSEWVADEGAALADVLLRKNWLTADQRLELDRDLAYHGACRGVGEHESRPHDEAPTLSLLGAASMADERVEVDEVNLDDLDLGYIPLAMRERITLRDLHSSGGIGEVWRAYDEVLGREVALKRLKAEHAAYQDNRARFFREAQITGQLEHPGIVPVYDYSSSEDGTRCFYTMRFLRGRTLREVAHEFHERRVAKDEPLVSAPLLKLLAQFATICDTMAFAHSRGVVHRDLKGDNVIIGDFGEVVVLDWGLAKRLGGAEARSELPSTSLLDSSMDLEITATMQGERLGTPAYMAPEQAQGRIDEIDARTDVYGLAAILYEILTGRPPFTGDDPSAIMEAVIRREPTPPRERVRDIPLALQRICLRGLAKDPSDRQPSVAKLADQIQGWLAELTERRRIEQERERFFDLSLDLLAIIDRRGTLSQTNAAWRHLLGWSEQRLKHRSIVEFVEPEHRELVAVKLAEIWDGERAVDFEIRMTRVDGRTRWVHGRARSIPGESAIYLVGRDVTERRQTEERFEGLLESAPDATCVIDTEGSLVLVNAQLERMFGYPRAELLGQPVEILVPESLRERHADHVRRFVTDPTPRPMGSGRRLPAQRKDGREFTVEVSLSPVETETGMLVACSLREVGDG